MRCLRVPKAAHYYFDFSRAPFFFDEKTGKIVLNDIFHFEQKEIDKDGQVIGEWVMDKRKPSFYKKFAKRVVTLPEGFFT